MAGFRGQEKSPGGRKVSLCLALVADGLALLWGLAGAPKVVALYLSLLGGLSHLFHQMLLCPPPHLHLVMNLTFRMNESDIHSLQHLPVPMSERTPLHHSTHTKGSPGQKQRTKITNPRSTDMFTRTYALTKSKWERDQGDRLQRIQRIQSNCKDG